MWYIYVNDTYEVQFWNYLIDCFQQDPPLCYREIEPLKVFCLAIHDPAVEYRERWVNLLHVPKRGWLATLPHTDRCYRVMYNNSSLVAL